MKKLAFYLSAIALFYLTEPGFTESNKEKVESLKRKISTLRQEIKEKKAYCKTNSKSPIDYSPNPSYTNFDFGDDIICPEKKDYSKKPFLKSQYNLAVIFDDNTDEENIKYDFERRFGNLPKYPFKITKQKTLENILAKKKIDKERFIEDPLLYKERLKDENINGILILGYSVQYFYNNSKNGVKVSSLTIDGRYYSFVYKKSKKLNLKIKNLPGFTLQNLKFRSIPEAVAEYVGNECIKPWEYEEKKSRNECLR